MLKENDFDRIERYVNGDADENEKLWVESKFLNGEENYALRSQLESDWYSLLEDTFPVEIDLNPLLDHVHHIIRKEELFEKRKPFRRLATIYMKAAAILILPLLVAGGLAYSILSNKSKPAADGQVSSTIYAPLGARVSFTLPDGTSGMLNSGSQLSYSIPFTSDRHIRLEGEAWFQVFHDEDHPFEISAGSSKVKVLGTSFNLSAYPAENYVEVVLAEGKVEFKNNNNKEEFIVLPSERLVSQNGIVSKSITDPGKYNAWTEGKLVFRGDPMTEVARRIERWYNVEVELADQKLERYSFRATFLDDSLEEVLRCLSLTSPITYNITPRTLLQDGTFKREVVTFYLK